MTISKSNSNALETLLKASVARYDRALAHFTGNEEPFKTFDIASNQEDGHKVFEIPMIPFRWTESFTGLHTMMVDDNERRTVCICRSYGAVRLPPYSHRRNERMIVIEGKIIDCRTGVVYEKESIIDYPADVEREFEFVDCIFNLILTPPLDFKQNQK